MKRLLGLLLVMGMVGCDLSVARLEDNASFQRNQDDEVVGVDGSSQTTDDDLRGLKRLPTLETLELQSTKVTDAGLVHLKGCLLYTSPSPRDGLLARMPSSA